jgi:hypothetical protein
LANMQMSLQPARRVMDKLLVMVDAIANAADIKRVIESNAVAVATIRKIRCLDAEPHFGEGVADLANRRGVGRSTRRCGSLG